MVCIIVDGSTTFQLYKKNYEMGRVSILLCLCAVPLVAKKVLVFFRDPISPTNCYCWTNIDKKLDQLVGPTLVSKIVGLGNLGTDAWIWADAPKIRLRVSVPGTVYMTFKCT